MKDLGFFYVPSLDFLTYKTPRFFGFVRQPQHSLNVDSLKCLSALYIVPLYGVYGAVIVWTPYTI